MAQIKRPATNWLDEAWNISKLVADMPNYPRGDGLLSVEPSTEQWELNPATKRQIELLQDAIALELAYRLRVIHKVKLRDSNGKTAMLFIEDSDPAQFRIKYAELGVIGVKFQVADLFAIDAHAKLSQILIDRFVCDEWKRILPLIVASIGGNPTAYTMSGRAAQPRPNVDRRSALSKAVAAVRRRNPELTAYEVLNRLDGGDVVQEHKNGRVYYLEGDKLVSVGLDRFETIFSEQKPSTG